MEQEDSLTRVTIFHADEASAGHSRAETTDFASLVRKHQSMVFSLAYHFLRDRAQAEEIAQEAFLRLYENLVSIESPSHMLRWLRKVTWRLCIDEVRRRPPIKSLNLDEVDEPIAALPESDLLLTEHLRRLVARLPESVRMTVILRYQEDLELAEIAQVLDAPLNTIKSRLQRGLAILRAKLTRYSGGIEI